MLAHGMEGERTQDEGGREKKSFSSARMPLYVEGLQHGALPVLLGVQMRARLASHNTIECRALILYLEPRIHRLYRVLHDANLFTNLHA